MPYKFLRKYGEAGTINFPLWEIDGIDFRVDATFASGDLNIMKDEGAEAATSNLPTDEGRGYSLVLLAAELTAKRIVIYIVDQSGTKVWLDDYIIIETYGHANAMHAFNLDYDFSDNIEILKLKQLSIVNDSGHALRCESTYPSCHGMLAIGMSGGSGIQATANGTGNANGIGAIGIGTGNGIAAHTTGAGNGIAATSVDGHGLYCEASTGGGGGSSGHGIYAIGNGDGYDGIRAQGDGSGCGINAIAGATGNGIDIVGGSTSGKGINVSTTDGTGLDITTANGIGIQINADDTAIDINSINAFGIDLDSAGPGIDINSTNAYGVKINAGSGVGLHVLGSNAVVFDGTGGNAVGLRISGDSNNGVHITGDGAASGVKISGGVTGQGVEIIGGSTSGNGLDISTTDGTGINIVPGGNNIGLNIWGGSSGGDAASLSPAPAQSGSGLAIYGGGSSNAFNIACPGGTGAGLVITSGTNQPAIKAQGMGSGVGFQIAGGTTGNGVEIKGGSNTGSGLSLSADFGRALDIAGYVIGGGSTREAIHVSCGATGDAIKLVPGSGSGHGINIPMVGSGHGINIVTNVGRGVNIDANGHGIYVESRGVSSYSAVHLVGSNRGLFVSGGIATELSGTDGGLKITSSGGTGIFVEGTGGPALSMTTGNDIPVVFVKGKSSGVAVKFEGGTTGNGIEILGGATSGKGIDVLTTDGIAFDLTAGGSNKDIDAKEIDQVLTNIGVVNGTVNSILSLVTIIDGKVDIANTGIGAIVAKLPAGTISDFALTDTIDGVPVSTILEYCMSMYNGKFDEDEPAPGKRTFYKRNNVTILSIIEVDDSGRRRIS